MKWIKVDEIIFDRYKVVERLGAGGQSFVYRAEDQNKEVRALWMKTVFIKQYTDLAPPEKEFKRVTAHFNKIKVKLKDIQNLICLPTYLDVCAKHGSIMAVFPFITGKKLSEKLADGLSFDERVRIAFAIVNTTRKIHEQEIAHLDLKPDNIVVYNSTRDDKIYIQVIDLDGSKISGVGVRPNVIKTIGYGSPEHFAKDGNDRTNLKSDIFSLGIMLLELLTGAYPFASTSTYLTLAKNKEFTLGPAQIHTDIIRLLMSCLDFDPDKRPSAGKMLSVFNRHHDNGLLALAFKERWDNTKTKMLVTLSGYNDNITFKRTYYENKILTSQDFRGSGLDTRISGDLFALVFENDNCTVLPLNGNIEFEIDGYQLFKYKHYQLLSNQVLFFEGFYFEIGLSYY